jgi:hypothetical protein
LAVCLPNLAVHESLLFWEDFYLYLWKHIFSLVPFGSDGWVAYQPPASSTFLSEQISHQQSDNSAFLSEQISTSHQPPAKRTGWGSWRRVFSTAKMFFLKWSKTVF